MQVNIAKSAGFCFGVKRAIDIAFKTARPGAHVCMLGDIVHNEDVVEQIKKTGIKKIKRLGNGKNKILLLRAHGTSLKIIKNALKRGYKIIDATCPMVKEIHAVACRMENRGYRIIVIGDKNHDEVLGIIGQLKTKPIVLASPADIKLNKLTKIKKAAVVTQSTQKIENVLKIVAILKKHIPGLEFFNTICSPTRLKQEEIKIMPKANDLMLIIGSKNSANTKRLYEISKSINKKSFWVQSTKDLLPQWFKNIKSVGITAGASTPERSIKEISEYLKNK